MQKRPYSMTLEELISNFKTNSKSGLTEKDAQKRLTKYGYNKLPETPPESLVSIFIRQFKNPLIYILLIAAIINVFSGRLLDTIFIIGILIINAIIGTIQEGKAQNIFQSLKKLIKSEAVVIRDGQKKIISDELLVPGDLILVQEGAKVPADARIIESDQLTVDEAILTGESSGVNKDDQLIKSEAEIFDQRNMVFRGTYILFGSAYAIVVATGSETEIGKLNIILKEIEIALPLKAELDKISYFVLIFAIIITITLFLVALFFKKSLWQTFFTLTALLVSIIPESLPIIFTISLAYGAYRMAKKNVLVKRLQAVDALGRTEVMIIDKTGTLTRNEMMVREIYTAGPGSDGNYYKITGSGYKVEGEIMLDDEMRGAPLIKVKQDDNLHLMAIAGLLLNRTEIEFSKKEKIFKVKGDPTEAAIYVFALKTGLNEKDIKSDFQKVYHFQFSPETRYHAGFFKHKNFIYLFVLGSPEHVLQLCINDMNKKVFYDSLEKLLHDGLRVVACAYKRVLLEKIDPKKLEDEIYLKNIINNLNFLGFYGIQDDIREGIENIIKEVQNAGIQIVMATGDHKATAMYVAKKVGIYKEGDNVINGLEFRNMSEQYLLNLLDKTTVCSRVTPEDKLNLVKGFHGLNKIVSMTGDGVNDVPPLLAADVGIAMGIIGTEVTKNAADMVLLDDSFFSLVEGIEWGRHIYFTVRRVVFYLLATNLGEVLLITYTILLNLQLPLTILQILLINVVTDGLLDFALVFEPKEKHLIRRPFPVKPKILDIFAIIRILLIGLLMSMSCLFLFVNYQKNYGLDYARSMTWLTLAIFQWFNAWNCRSEYKSLINIGFLKNVWIVYANIVVLIISVIVIYFPPFQEIFETVSLAFSDWLLAIFIASSILIFDELRKKWFVKF